MAPYLGDFPAGQAVYSIFTTVKATGSPGALVSGAARVIKNGATGTLGSTGVTLTANIGGKTGLNRIRVLTSGAIYTSGDYQIVLSTGSVDGKNVAGYAIDSFSIKARNRLAYTLTTGQHDSIGTRTWAVTARTLTSGGVMWSAGSRLLTSGAAVWAAGTKALTDKAGFALTSGQHDTIGTRVWANGTKVLTSGGVVWSAGTRTLTSGGVAWTAAARTLTSGGVMWTAAARTLTSGAVMNTAKLAQQTTAPSASGPTVGAAIMWNYQAIRNKRQTTATTDRIYTASGGVAGTATLVFATAGTGTFTKGKYA